MQLKYIHAARVTLVLCITDLFHEDSCLTDMFDPPRVLTSVSAVLTAVISVMLGVK